MTTVLIRRNAPTDSCHNFTALMPRCTKTSFLITPHYIYAHRNSDNLHNAAFKGYSLVAWGMADEHLIVVLHQLTSSTIMNLSWNYGHLPHITLLPWILHQLDREGHPGTEGPCMESTPRPQEYLALCHAWWPQKSNLHGLGGIQRHGRLLQCKKLGSMAATQVCSGWCSTLHGGIGSGMRSSMEISLESLQKSGREDFEWQDTVSDTLNWLQATSRSMGTDAGTSFTRRPVFDFYRPAAARY